MTCIVGIVHDGRVTIGGDSAGVAGLDIITRKDRKVFRVGDFALGYTTSFRMGQLLAFGFEPPHRKPEVDPYEYMVTSFIDAVRARMKEHGFAKVENNQESGGEFLVGVAGRLFHVESDFQVGEPVAEYAACGCGESFALGSLRNSGHLSPRARIEQSLETAAEFSAGVRGPFHLITV